MPDYYFDLHIHTALSPCAADDMTPNNIVNMANIKGLDFIAITDHNSAKNAAAVVECAKGTGLVVIPGMEVEVAEEFHLICLFQDIESLMNLQKVIYHSLPLIENKKEVFGKQLIIDIYDNIVGEETKLLSTAANINVESLIEFVIANRGIIYPAHIDREAYSIISTFGCIPKNLGFNIAEVSRNVCTQNIFGKYAFLEGYRVVSSSDAHQLGAILERVERINLEEKSIEGFFKVFGSK